MYNYLLFDIVYGHPPYYLDGCSYVFRVYLCKMYVIVRVRTSKECVSCAVDLMFCLFCVHCNVSVCDDVNSLLTIKYPRTRRCRPIVI